MDRIRDTKDGKKENKGKERIDVYRLQKELDARNFKEKDISQKEKKDKVKNNENWKKIMYDKIQRDEKQIKKDAKNDVKLSELKKEKLSRGIKDLRVADQKTQNSLDEFIKKNKNEGRLR